MTLEPGQSLDLDTRVDGGPVITRDPNVEDALTLEEPYSELGRDEIRRMAEAIGLEVDA